MNRSHRIALLIAGVAVTAGAQAASADVRVHVGGSAHVRIGGGPVRARWIRPWRVHHRPRPVIHIGGSIWVGRVYQPGPFAQPPPPPPPVDACNCEAPTYYPPIAPAPASYPVSASYAAAPPAERPLPRFGLGAFLGGVDVDGEHEGEDVGLAAQIRLGRALILEGEIAKNELEDGERVDRRIMLGLQLELAPRRRASPYIVGAIGGTQVQVGDEWRDNQSLAEFGGGLRYRLSDRLQIFGDMRWGTRETVEQDEPRPLPVDDGGVASKVVPGSEESYARGRAGIMLMF